MAFTYRVFSVLESELRKQLCFSFSIERNLTNPGADKVRPQDRLLLKVSARNDSGIALKSIRGTVRAGSMAGFSTVAFFLPLLSPGEEKEIARVEAEVLRTPHTAFLFDELATISVTAQADLSEFIFRETDRPLTYAHPTGRPGPRLVPAPAARAVTIRRVAMGPVKRERLGSVNEG